MQKFIWLGLILSIFASNASSQQESDPNSFVQVNVSLDLQGIEESIDATSDSLYALADSLTQIAQSPDLTPEQQNDIDVTIDNVNQLIDVSTQSLEKLPVAFSQSKQVVGEKTQLFLDDVKLNLIIFLALIVLALIVIMVCIYWFLLRPLQSTVVTAATQVTQMAQALRVTAKAVETCTEKQQAISEQLAKHT
jgi:septal ring factor EnvC (AmiA/AmiB activator)